MAIDASSTPTYVDEIPPQQKTNFVVNAYEGDASTAVEVKADPGDGLAIYITDIILQSDDADAHPYLQDEDDNVIFGPLYSTVEGASIELHLGRGALKLVSGKALEIAAAAAGNIFIFVKGAVAQA